MTKTAKLDRSKGEGPSGPGAGFAKALRDNRTSLLLDRLYRCERAGVLAYLRREVGTDHAGDLVQDVFMRAATSAELDTLRNPGGYLHCIARNLAIDFLRRRTVRGTALPLTETIDTAIGADQEDRLLASEAQDTITTALAMLPPKTARIFMMNRFEEKTYREIHAELGIALATVDYHMMKAISHLKAAFQSDL